MKLWRGGKLRTEPTSSVSQRRRLTDGEEKVVACCQCSLELDGWQEMLVDKVLPSLAQRLESSVSGALGGKRNAA